MVAVQCPHCGSASLTDTEEGTVYPDEITQEYRCDDCGKLCSVRYSPIEVTPVQEEDNA